MNEKGTDVLQQYDLDIIRTSRVRGAVLCETRQGCRLLKEYKGTEARMEQVQQVLAQLEECTGVAVDRAIPNREGKWITVDADQTPYVVKEWNSGRECDLLVEEEVLRGVRLLAALHEGLRQVDSSSFTQEDSLLNEYRRHNAELRRARNFVRKVRHKSDFELTMIRTFPAFFEQAKEAQRLLEQWDMMEEVQEPTQRNTMGEVQERTQRNAVEEETRPMEDREENKQKPTAEKAPYHLCHGEYSHHHILYDGEFAMVTDFLAMTRGVQVSDLYYLMRKAMEKQGFDSGIGRRMLEEYDRHLPLTEGDRRYLYIRFLYPEKYWKQINYYFNSNKAWIPARSTEKIQALQELEPERRNFLDFFRRGGIG